MTHLASCHLVAAPGDGVQGMLAWCVLGDTVVGVHVTGVPKEMAFILAASLPWEGRLSWVWQALRRTGSKKVWSVSSAL